MAYAPLLHPDMNRFFSRFWDDPWEDDVLGMDMGSMLDWPGSHRHRGNKRRQGDQQQIGGGKNIEGGKQSNVPIKNADSTTAPSSTTEHGGAESQQQLQTRHPESQQQVGRVGAVNRRLPRFELRDEKDALMLRAETPGVPKENIKVQLHDDRLTISGEDRKEERGDNFYVNSFGSFEHSWTLPKNVDREGLNAQYSDGVLCVRLPKRAQQETQPRNINIQ